jgi:hypothetical protein
MILVVEVEGGVTHPRTGTLGLLRWGSWGRILLRDVSPVNEEVESEKHVR